MKRLLFCALATAFVATPSLAGVTVIGSSPARLCYEAADLSAMPTLASLGHCNEALASNVLGRYDTIATHVNRGIVRLRRGDIDGGIDDFDAAIALDPDQPEAYLNKGAALVRKEQASAALPMFNLALEKNTRRPALAYYGRGVVHEAIGDLRAAYHDYRQALALAPGWRAPAEELARFQVRSN